MASAGLIRPSGVEIRPKALSKAAQQLGSDSYGTLNLAGTELAYSIAEGQAKLEPFVLKLGPVKSTARGTVGLVNETLDLVFHLKIPKTGIDGTLKLTGSWDAPKIDVGLDPGDAEDVVGDLVDAVLGDAPAKDGKAAARPARPARRRRSSRCRCRRIWRGCGSWSGTGWC